MEKSTRRLIISIVLILLACGLCISLVVLAGLGIFVINRTSTSVSPPAQVVVSTEVVLTTPTVENTPTVPSPTSIEPSQTITSSPTQPLPSETQSSTQTPSLPAQIVEQMDQIQDQVVQLRGLEPKGPVKRDLLTQTQLRQHVLDDFLADYSPDKAKQDALVLASFGLLEPNFDLYNFYIDLYTEQIAGFYDDKTKEMYVIQGQGFQGPERLTYAHEYDHALQDQNYDIEHGLDYSQAACEKDSERCAAVQALMEGDASLLQTEWYMGFATAQDRNQIQQFYSTYQSPVFDSAPTYMQQDFLFPYVNGQTFVEYLHTAGGWSSVDQAYQELPVSTEQILHPNLYPADKPITVTLPDIDPILGEGWEMLDQETLGEWYTYLVLAYGLDPQDRLDTSIATNASAGWGGDQYIVYYNAQTNETVLVLKTIWDTTQDADEFNTAFRDYGNKRFGNPEATSSNSISWSFISGYSEFHLQNQQTNWILGPDVETTQAIWAAIQNP